jgi:mRNA interferase RelE/StbE
MSWSVALAWTVEFTRTAEKQITKFDRQTQARILRFLRERVQAVENPRQLGKALQGEKQGMWRYRVGDYRIICGIRDEENTVTVLVVGHRKELYR